MAVLNPTFIFGLFVLFYLASFVIFAVIRILTGISIQRLGYFSLRRLTYTPKDGTKIEIRGLGLHIHRPTFAQPTWLSIVVSELAITIDISSLNRLGIEEEDSEGNGWQDEKLQEQKQGQPLKTMAKEKLKPQLPPQAHINGAQGRSKMWIRLTHIKERIKKLHRNINWLRMVDVVATNSIIEVVDVGNIQCGSLTIAVDTRKKIIDRPLSLLQHSDKQQPQQAEWIITMRSVLFTTKGREPLEIVDNVTLGIHGYLYEALDGLRDAAIALKLGRVHLPYDDFLLCSHLYNQLKQADGQPDTEAKVVEVQDAAVSDQTAADTCHDKNSDNDLMLVILDSKDFVSSILRGIKEVRFAASFIGIATKLDSPTAAEAPVLLSASMKEVGVDLHRLDPKSPAHRMYFPSKDIAHEALAAALSISVAIDDSQGRPEQVLYIPMTTTTVRTTLPSKTVQLSDNGSLSQRNDNILFANSVVTSPSVDLYPRHLPLLMRLLRSQNTRTTPRRQSPMRSRYLLISRLLPKADVKFSMNQPVVRVALPPVEPTDDQDEFDLLISSVSSISFDMESFHSDVEDVHYSLGSSVRIQSHNLYYQTAKAARFDLLNMGSVDLKLDIHASPDIRVAAEANLQTLCIKMIQPEIMDGLRQITMHLRRDENSPRHESSTKSGRPSGLRSFPPWLLRLDLQAKDFYAEVAGVDESVSSQTRGIALGLESWAAEYRAHEHDNVGGKMAPSHSRRFSTARSRSIVEQPSNTQSSKPAKLRTLADGRRLLLSIQGLEGVVVRASDQGESIPFMAMPSLVVILSTSNDGHGPILHIQSQLQTLKINYSLYRHYAVLIAARVITNTFTQQGNRDASGSSSSNVEPPRPARNTYLSPHTPYRSLGDAYGKSDEIVTTDFKVGLVQVKFDMPHDPPTMIHIAELQQGYQRWSPPVLRARLICLYVEAPRIPGVWVRILTAKSFFIQHRLTKGLTSQHVSERLFNITTQAVRICVPHEVLINKVSDNFINVLKVVQQLHYQYKTGMSSEVLEKKYPQSPRVVPKVSFRTRSLLFELEDGAFEWRLGMIYRAGRIEQVQRLAREEAFRLKVKRIHEEESRKGLRQRNRSAMMRGKTEVSPMASWRRSHSEDRRPRTATDNHRGRAPRYDPDGHTENLSGDSRISILDARHKLHVLNAQSWKKRIQRQYAQAEIDAKVLRGSNWESDDLSDNVQSSEHILELTRRAPLLTVRWTDLHFDLDKPSFPLKDLPEYLYRIGKGIPRDMKYSLLVPMNLRFEASEVMVSIRDYPLPVFHVPPLKPGQTFRNAFSMRSDFVIAEEFHGVESTRRIKVDVIPQNLLDSKFEESYPIYINRTLGPVKTYSDISVDVNTGSPTRITWGPSLQPGIQDVMMVIESFTKPQVDMSERVGFWDKIRLNFHSRIRLVWKGDGDVHLNLKGSRDPYSITGYGAGMLMCWRTDVRLSINTSNDPKRLIAVDSGAYILAIPDLSRQAREAERRHYESVSAGINNDARNGALFQKVVMKLSGQVQLLAGLVFEQPIKNGIRCFDFKPHYDVVLKAPEYAKQVNGEPYDAFRGFRSQHIHLSLDIRAPLDRQWTSDKLEPSRSYNTVHLTPRFFTHFFAWWSLFSGPMSLPIRQGSLWPGREKNSKKFGRHLATIKYNLLLAPLYLSHIYRHKDLDDHGPEDEGLCATGIKVRFDSFMLDMHQRREEFNTRNLGRKTQGRTSGMRIHAAQLDLASTDIRAVSATTKGTTSDAVRTCRPSELVVNPTDDVGDLSHFKIPDNDLSWVDMDDFVELTWIIPLASCPDIEILPLAYAPRITYFRQTDIEGVIAGDPARTSPFGHEPTHLCIMSHDDPRKVQSQLIEQRLEQLVEQMENHERNIGDAQLRGVRDNWNDETIRREFDALIKHTNVLQSKKDFLNSMLRQMNVKVPVFDQPPAQQASALPDMSIRLEGVGEVKLPAGAQFASGFTNRFVVHNLQLKWNNELRNIILRYIHQVSQRRGFVYYLSRPAVKFILDIVEEQAKAKATKADPPGGTPKANNGPSEPLNPHEANDIEDHIRKILAEGKQFVNVEPGSDHTAGTIEDLTGDIASEFTPQNNYHVRLIAPQIQLQSSKNKKHVVLIAAKGMELKVVEVMDKMRLSDMVSGIVQRRVLLQMDGAQFFVTHQKWFSRQLVSLYSGGTYGAEMGTSWPPWVPMEVMFDYHADPFGFMRVVQRTSGSLRYDKYNTLRLKYNDEVGKGGSSSDNPESRMDNIWVEFPQARALCNSSQYHAVYVIVTDLLLYSEPLEKTRAERLEKIMLASDFSDLRGTPEAVTRLQDRIRQLEQIKAHFQIHNQSPDLQGWSDRLSLERDLVACSDELFFMMKAITRSQKKYDTAAQSNALVRWSISAREIVWHLLRDASEPLVELQLKNVEYDRTDNSDGSHANVIRVGNILGLNLLPNAMYPEMFAPYVEMEKGSSLPSLSSVPHSIDIIRVYWYMLGAVAGIPVMAQLEVSLFPLKIQLERDVGVKFFEYIFPNSEEEEDRKDSDTSSLAMYTLEEEIEEAYSILTPEKDSFATGAGSLESRLKPTLHSDAFALKSKPAPYVQGVDNASLHAPSFRERWFRSGVSSNATKQAMIKKRSIESLSSFAHARTGNGGRAPSTQGKETATLAAPSANKVSRFSRRRTPQTDDDQVSDDITKMVARANNYMTFAHINVPSVVLCLSYKGKGERNIEDVHNFVFKLPTIEYHNKTWSHLDLALALKSRVLKALLSHTGAIIGNKFSKNRPGAAQQNRLRELATNSVLLANPANFGRGVGSNYGGSASNASNDYEDVHMFSDNASSAIATSPVDYSRSSPVSRSQRNSSQASMIVPLTGTPRSRSSSVLSGVSGYTGSLRDDAVRMRRALTGTVGGQGNSVTNAPTLFMMTPPSPRGRPSTSGGLRPSGFLYSSPTHATSSPRRPMTSGMDAPLMTTIASPGEIGSASTGSTLHDSGATTNLSNASNTSVISPGRRRGAGEKLRGKLAALKDKWAGTAINNSGDVTPGLSPGYAAPPKTPIDRTAPVQFHIDPEHYDNSAGGSGGLRPLADDLYDRLSPRSAIPDELGVERDANSGERPTRRLTMTTSGGT